MIKQKALITGLGIVTSLGLGLKTNWDAALKGQNGIRLIQDIYPNSPISVAGIVSKDDVEEIKRAFPQEANIEGESRTLFALWAAKEAIDDAGLNQDQLRQSQISFSAGLGINRLEDIFNFMEDKSFSNEMLFKNYSLIHKESILRNNSHRPPALIARRFGVCGRNITVTSACASATQAIGIGLRAIQRGETDIVIAGGSDSMINPVGLIFFVLLGAASPSKDTTACKPFDSRRSGLVMGEGAGFLVLESEKHAIKRGANIYCEIAGYGASIDAYQITAPEPNGKGAIISMTKALEDASIRPEEVDYINAHGTSTKLNDISETIAIKEVFKEHAYNLKINSSKSLIGHLLSASGAPEAVFTAMSVKDDIIHPTLNLSSPDTKCDLDYTANKPLAITIRNAMSNSFGFGGQNTTLLFRKYGG
ncbi:MAG: beta-ketoacyl-[acyl-carrier-protein] synthase family protein [Thermodesulfovibrionales bacterium]|nr:beta-ketoacyl-[acyl-carrier-protein] synthase family protein [Thermodesulfovibrionales bacterium]